MKIAHQAHHENLANQKILEKWHFFMIGGWRDTDNVLKN